MSRHLTSWMMASLAFMVSSCLPAAEVGKGTEAARLQAVEKQTRAMVDGLRDPDVGIRAES